MDLNEIGAALREAREHKGLSIDAVEEKTKIAPSVITALEEGNRARFPHPVYARGFVRSYALLLGLDAVELCGHFSREYPVPTETEHPEVRAPQITVRMHDSGRVDTAVRIAAILGILIIGALGWYAFDVYRSRLPQAPVQETVPAPAPTSTPAPAQAVPAETLPAPLTQMQELAAETRNETGATAAGEGNASSVAPGNASHVLSPEPGKPVETKPGAEKPAPPEKAVALEKPSSAKPAPGPVAAGATRTLRISATSASWLQARPDGKVVDYFLRKGESTVITYSKSLTIKFGNAGGVGLELDGQPYPFEAAVGEVKTLVLE
jgi:cytoskeleton protein RodZ